MQGLNAHTGGGIADLDHLRQSVRDILTTPIGSRVLRRDYGSRLLDLVDRPFTQALRLEIIAEAIGAILRWEPRIEVQEVKLQSHSPGEVVLDLVGVYIPDGRAVFVEGVLVA